MTEKGIFRGLFLALFVAVGALAAAIIWKHSAEFYTVLRWLCFVTFLWSGVAFAYGAVEISRTFHKGDQTPVIFHLIIATLSVAAGILFNPIAEFHFPRQTWLLLDKLSLGFAILVALLCLPKLELPSFLKRWLKYIVWFIVAGIVAYYTFGEVVHTYGKYAFATATAKAKVVDMDEDAVDSETGRSGVRYTAIYKFTVNGKAFYGRTEAADLGDEITVRYNPANPDENRHPDEGWGRSVESFLGFAIIIGGLVYWFRWIVQSERTSPCVEHPNRRTKKRFYHWEESGKINYVVDHGPRCEECIAQLREKHRMDGCSELLYKPLPEAF